ncbi:MAG: hypothetical protein JXQ75_09245 [Phycisphaerae bacterium]|nr:hypothetical protein [Phycisphaerae bacterium]
MRRKTCLFAASLLGASLVTACVPARYDDVEVLKNVPDSNDLLTTSFQPASGILSGFDVPDGSSDWRIGDRVLFGLQIDRGGKHIVRFVLFELKSGVLPPDADVVITRPDDRSVSDDPSGKTAHIVIADEDDDSLIGRLPARRWSMTTDFIDKAGNKHNVTRDSDPVLVVVHVYDDCGRRLKPAGTLAPEAYLRRGFYAACVTAVRMKHQPPIDRRIVPQELADILPSLYGFGQMMGETRNLWDIIQKFMPRPSLWSLVVHGGRVEFVATAGLGDVEEDDRLLPALRGERRAYRFPVDIDTNGEPAIRCLLSVVDPAPPFHLCAGVVGLDGVQVKDATCRFTLRLLAAQRAKAAPLVSNQREPR